MEPLLTAFAAALLGGWADKTQAVAAMLAERYRSRVLLPALILAVAANSAASAIGGSLLRLEISAHAAALLLAVALAFAGVAGLIGRFVFSWLSEAIGRRPSGILLSFGTALGLYLAGVFHSAFIGGVSMFWLMVMLARFFSDGGYAVVGPYAAEVWPTGLRASGMGFGYGLGNFGKVIGPLGLALIAGSSNYVNPKADLAALEPAMIYLAAWCALSGLVFLFLGFETKGRSIEEIDRDLAAGVAPARVVPVPGE